MVIHSDLCAYLPKCHQKRPNALKEIRTLSDSTNQENHLHQKLYPWICHLSLDFQAKTWDPGHHHHDLTRGLAFKDVLGAGRCIAGAFSGSLILFHLSPWTLLVHSTFGLKQTDHFGCGQKNHMKILKKSLTSSSWLLLLLLYSLFGFEYFFGETWNRVDVENDSATLMQCFQAEVRFVHLDGSSAACISPLTILTYPFSPPEI